MIFIRGEFEPNAFESGALQIARKLAGVAPHQVKRIAPISGDRRGNRVGPFEREVNAHPAKIRRVEPQIDAAAFLRPDSGENLPRVRRVKMRLHDLSVRLGGGRNRRRAVIFRRRQWEDEYRLTLGRRLDRTCLGDGFFRFLGNAVEQLFICRAREFRRAFRRLDRALRRIGGWEFADAGGD